MKHTTDKPQGTSERCRTAMLMNSGVISTKTWGGGRPNRRPFLSTLEPFPTPGDTSTYRVVCTRQ